MAALPWFRSSLPAGITGRRRFWAAGSEKPPMNRPSDERRLFFALSFPERKGYALCFIMEQLLRVEINMLCLCIVAMVAYGERRRKRDSVGVSVFIGLILATAAMIVFDSVTWLFDGRPGNLARIVLFVANGAYYFFHSLPLLLFLQYADFQLFRDPVRSAKLRPWLAIPFVLMAVAALVSPFTGFLFTIDGGNRYVRGPGFPAFAAVALALALLSVILIVANRHLVSRRAFFSLLFYPIPVMVAGGFQAFFMALSWSGLPCRSSSSSPPSISNGRRLPLTTSRARPIGGAWTRSLRQG